MVRLSCQGVQYHSLEDLFKSGEEFWNMTNMEIRSGLAYKEWWANQIVFFYTPGSFDSGNYLGIRVWKNNVYLFLTHNNLVFQFSSNRKALQAAYRLQQYCLDYPISELKLTEERVSELLKPKHSLSLKRKALNSLQSLRDLFA